MGELNSAINISMRAISDLFLGTGIAKLTDHIFNSFLLNLQPNEESKPIVMLSLLVFSQCAITTIMGMEARNFFYDQEYFDPTGGLVLISSIFRQKGFWERVDNLWRNILDFIATGIFELDDNSNKPLKLHKSQSTTNVPGYNQNVNLS